MASVAITASLHIACSTHHVPKKQQPQPGPARSPVPKQATHVTLDVEGQKGLNMAEHHERATLDINKSKNAIDEVENGSETQPSAPKFADERWKNGTWDLNMFVKNGKMDWDGVITAEARRRKFLELYPEAATNQEPVLFRSSIIPWWAWLVRSYLPEAELLNGRAAMVGFFMAYLVDALTGLDVVGQTGNFLCKAGLFVTVISVILFRRTQDFETLKRLADEATFYDKQWQASWQDKNASTGALEQNRKRN
ncbi:hypothetical protein FH972_013605 [Carpinus fangiana]|uniref:Uncharacterized protein n=1 Tax=Carpinus fangiana TaxID=176857 RepID=A0A5N6R793_9ROSI|nr:hypothetical protein FH972_013605 [Carpinus fangiana]